MLPCSPTFPLLQNKRSPSLLASASSCIGATLRGGSCDTTVYAALVDLLCSSPHLPQLVARLLPTDESAASLLRDVLNLSGSARGDATAVTFIAELAKVKPRVVVRAWKAVEALLGRESHQMRSAVCQAIGVLAGGTVEEEEEDVEEKKVRRGL